MSFTNILDKYHYRILVVIFIVIFSMGYSLIFYDANQRTKQHLVDKMENTFIQYKLILNTYKKNSKSIYYNISKNKDIINILTNLNESNKDISREKLQKIVEPIYNSAKKIGIKQLHFHLKNNESFLRMHKPKKYGDDLSDFRYSVAYVNSKQRGIIGFEQGKIIHGYRYVYPLKNADLKHIGSVEVSISTKSFEKIFENTLFIDAKFIINKQISKEKLFDGCLEEYYINTFESPLYIQDKKQTISNGELNNYIKNNTNRYQKLLKEKLASEKAFAVDIDVKNTYFIQTFIPMKNIKERKVVAYFITTVESSYLEQLHKDTIKLTITLLFFVLLIMYVIHRNLNYASTLRKEVKEKTHELQVSQKRVVQAEKMASLGMLITGVAHEINTPIGLSITAITSLLDDTKILKSDYDNQTMDEKEFENYLIKSSKTEEIIFINLVRIAELVKNFKQLSTNQNLKDKVEIDLKQYLDSLIISLDSKLKEKNIDIEVNIEDNIHLSTYPDALSQIFNNFISNSLTHAFLNIQNPKININIKKKNGNIRLFYRDNGVGIDENKLKKVYDPFYTTNRGAGNSGLGMHIIYNLITNKLDGNIHITSEIDNGVAISVTLPTIGK